MFVQYKYTNCTHSVKLVTIESFTIESFVFCIASEGDCQFNYATTFTVVKETIN